MRKFTPEMEQLIERAAAFAEMAHTGQKRKGNGDPYIVHPSRVAAMVSPYLSPAAIAAAYLHDVIEDTEYQDLSQFPKRVRDLVRLLTKIPGEPKAVTIERVGISLDEEGILLKVADRTDNLTDGTDLFGKKWLTRYVEGAESLYGFAAKAGLEDHYLVRVFRSVIDLAKKRAGQL